MKEDLKINEKKQFTQEDLEQILGGSAATQNHQEASAIGSADSSDVVAARTGYQQAAVSDNLN